MSELHHAISIGHGSAFLRPRGRRQNDISQIGRFRQKNVLHDQPVKICQRCARVIQIGVGHGRVLAHDVHTANFALACRVDDLDHSQSGHVIELSIPQFFEFGVSLRVVNALVIGKHHRDQTGIGRALHIVLSTQWM